MEESTVQSNEDSVEKPPSHGKQEETLSTNDLQEKSEESEFLKSSSADTVRKTSKIAKPNSSTLPKGIAGTAEAKKKTDMETSSIANPIGTRPNLTKSTISSASRSLRSVPVTRRNSTGGLPEKKPISVTKRMNAVVGSVAGRKSSSLAEPVRRSLPEVQTSSLSSVGTRPRSRTSISDIRKSAPVSPVAKTLRSSPSSDVSKQDSKKTPMRQSRSSVSSTKRAASTSLESTGSSSVVRKVVGKVSSPTIRTPMISSGSRGGLLSTSVDRSSNLSSRRRAGTPESRDSRLIMLPQVETKAGDDVRLDLRGHKIRNLNSSGLNLSPNLEFVYLRDNLLSTLEGIKILSRVKVLDLSFNDFKGPGFEPLENCKVLQQLYLAGNQITSLISLPELPNLEFLSVAQNKLKSLAMASQPRLQVLAASKNKISTLKGFPYFPVLEHLRLEENPILKMPHLEAASILLVGPTLKKFNDRDLSREEIVLAKRYPAHTALCLRGGWEFCRSDQALRETGRMYEANVDDVGYRLVAIYTPIREDGLEGHPFSVSTEPIAVEPDVHKEVKLNLDLGSIKFEVLCDKDRSSKKVPGLGNLERRILEVNRKRIKVVKPGSKTSFSTTEIRGSYAPPFHVELFRNDQHRLRIVVDSENEIDLMVQTRHLRDVIVLVIRGLAQRFNSTSLNSLLKLET